MHGVRRTMFSVVLRLDPLSEVALLLLAQLRYMYISEYVIFVLHEQ